MSNIHAQALEFSNVVLDLFFCRIPAHVSQIFVGGATQDFINDSCKSIGNTNFGFVGRAKS